MTFDEWWHFYGSGLAPGPNDDMETHAKNVAKWAWESSKNQKNEISERLVEAKE